MARECSVCGKRSQMGNSVEIRGKAKYLGGVGTKVTGITRRKFRPNLQRVRIAMPEGGARRVLVCTQCIRSGAIRKAVSRTPFSLPGQPAGKKSSKGPQSVKSSRSSIGQKGVKSSTEKSQKSEKSSRKSAAK